MKPTQKTISQHFYNAKGAYGYALDVVKGRWEEGEEIISQHSIYSFEYAAQVLGGRFRLGEPAIMKNVRYAVEYAKDVIKGRWSELEEYITSFPNNLYSNHWPREVLEYAKEVIKGRWPEAEYQLDHYPFWATEYAIDVVKGRFESGEPVIPYHLASAERYIREMERLNIDCAPIWQLWFDKDRSNNGVSFQDFADACKGCNKEAMEIGYFKSKVLGKQ